MLHPGQEKVGAVKKFDAFVAARLAHETADVGAKGLGIELDLGPCGNAGSIVGRKISSDLGGGCTSGGGLEGRGDAPGVRAPR